MGSKYCGNPLGLWVYMCINGATVVVAVLPNVASLEEPTYSKSNILQA